LVRAVAPVRVSALIDRIGSEDRAGFRDRPVAEVALAEWMAVVGRKTHRANQARASRPALIRAQV
jgi:hypothetical protein